MARSQYHLLRMGRIMSNGTDAGVLQPPTPPPVVGYPGPANTGAKGTLTTDARTQINSTANGQVFQNLDVTLGWFFIRHDNVTIRNCRIHSDQYYAIEAETTNNLLIEDCTITGIGGASGIGSGNSVTIRRCDISGYENGIFFGGDSVIEYNYIHDLLSLGGSPHFDGMQTGGCSSALIQYNTIIATDTSHVFVQNSFGPCYNVKVLNNKFLKDARGAPSANVYFNTDSTAAPIDNVEVAYNVGDRGFYTDFDVSPNVTNVNIHDNHLGEVIPPGTPGTTANFYGTAIPGGGTAEQPGQLTLGANFEPLVPGKVQAIRFYRGSAAAAADGKVALWHRDGSLLKMATYTGHTGVGWKTVDIDFGIDQLGTYTVGVWAKPGSDSQCHYWAEAGTFGTWWLFANNGTLNLAKMPESSGQSSRGFGNTNNVFRENNGDIKFPDQTYNGGGYAVDIDFVPYIPAVPADPTTPPSGWDDARFASNFSAPTYVSPLRDVMVIQNRDFIGASTFGDPLSTSIVGVKYINSRFKGREGPRIGGPGVYEYIGCYIECMSGASDDHADGLQAYCPGSAPTVRIIGTRVTMKTDLGFGNNTGVFFSDNARATLTIKDCYFDGMVLTNSNASTDMSVLSLSVENLVVNGALTLVGPAGNWTGKITKWINVTNGSGTPIPNPYP